MRIKNGYTVRDVSGCYLVIALGEVQEDYRRVVSLNESGKMLFDILNEKDATADELVSAVLDEYEIDEETAKRDVQTFIETMKNAGIIE